MTKELTKEQAIKMLSVLHLGKSRIAKEACEMAIQALQQTKEGYWISEGYYADGSNIQAFRCSECGNHILEYETGVYNLCPVCRCRMKGVWSE